MKSLDQVAVILVGTTHPGNIGATARAMGNMGFARLALARPQSDPLDPEAVARSSGCGAILDSSVSYPDLAGALQSSNRVYAYTARRRGMSQQVLDPREAGAQAASDIQAGNKVALVFGPEQSGLTNTELDLCDCVVTVPTSNARPSLNVAAAVLIACYELKMAAGTEAKEAGDESELASKGEILDLLGHTEQILQDHYPSRHPGLLAKMMRRLTLLVNRAVPDKADVRMLRGLLNTISKGKK